jgi:hypothetical protein
VDECGFNDETQREFLSFVSSSVPFLLTMSRPKPVQFCGDHSNVSIRAISDQNDGSRSRAMDDWSLNVFVCHFR